MHDAIKGDRWFQIVRNSDFEITQRWDMGKELAEAGYPDMSSAVRPMAIAPDERCVYFQVSFFHGCVEFDTQAADLNGKVDYTAGGDARAAHRRGTRVIDLPEPGAEHAARALRQRLGPPRPVDERGRHDAVRGRHDGRLRRADRPHDEDAQDLRHRDHRARLPQAVLDDRGPDNTCWISLSGDDSVAVLDFTTKQELAYLAVGDHPQRIRHGYVPEDALAAGAGS